MEIIDSDKGKTRLRDSPLTLADSVSPDHFFHRQSKSRSAYRCISVRFSSSDLLARLYYVLLFHNIQPNLRCTKYIATVNLNGAFNQSIVVIPIVVKGASCTQIKEKSDCASLLTLKGLIGFGRDLCVL